MVASNVDGFLDRFIGSVRGTMTPEVARVMRSWRFAEEDHRRVADLSAKARQGSLTDDEGKELDYYIFVDDFLSVLRLEAEHALKMREGASEARGS